MAILNVNNPGDVVLDQAPEPQSPGLPPPVADDVPGMPNLMATVPNAPPVAAAPPPAAPAPAPQQPAAPAAPQPRFTMVDQSAPITLDPPPQGAPAATSGIQRVPTGTKITLDPVTPPPETYAQAAGQALMRGVGKSISDVADAAHPFKQPDYTTYSTPIKVTNPATGDTTTMPMNSAPAPDAVDQVINGPFWRGDVKNTIGGEVVRLASNLGEMAPTAALGIAGTVGGGYAGEAAAGPPGAAVGALAGGAAGFGSGAALQTIVPAYKQGIADGLTQDQAVDAAVKKTWVAGGIGALMGLAPGLKIFGKSWQLAGVGKDGIGEMVNMARKPVTEALVQMGVIQPSLGAVQQTADAAIDNKPITGADLAAGYARNAEIGGVIHGISKAGEAIFPETKPLDNPMQSAPGAGGGARPEPPIYDADVVTPPKKLAGPDNGQGAPDTGNPPPQPAPGGGVNVTVDVPLSRDDLANAINNKTPLPTKKTITLPDVPIAPELQAQGFTVGNRVQQVTDDGEVHEGTVASARNAEDGTEVTMLDDTGNLRTLFSTDGPIVAAKVPPAVSQPAAPTAPATPKLTPNGVIARSENGFAIPPAPVSAPPAPRTAPAAPAAKNENLYAQMDLPALKNSLDFVNNHAKNNGGWNKGLTTTKKAITDELNTRFPEWQVPARAAVASAAADVAAAPTEAQKEAGNYQKGHVSIQGLPVTLETTKGQIRSGVGPDGKPWEVPMPAHYGYIKRTTGADNEHVDVYVGNHPDSPHVYVVDQIDHNANKFDEHKALIGFSSLDEALKTYQQAFSDGNGAARMGGVSTMSVQEFKQWLRKPGARKSPLAYGQIKSADITNDYMAEIKDTAERVKTLHAKRRADDVLTNLSVALDKKNVEAEKLAKQYFRFLEEGKFAKSSENNTWKRFLKRSKILADQPSAGEENAKNQPETGTTENKPATQQPEPTAETAKNAPEQQQETVKTEGENVQHKRVQSGIPDNNGAKVPGATPENVEGQKPETAPPAEVPGSGEAVRGERGPSDVAAQDEQGSGVNGGNGSGASHADTVPDGLTKTFGELDEAIANKSAVGLRTLIGNLDNTKTRARFEEKTGIKLPKTKSGTLQAIDDFTGITPEERARVDLERDNALEEKKKEWTSKAAERKLAGVQISMPDGTKIDAKTWADKAIADGYDNVVRTTQNGKTEYALAKPDGQAYNLTKFKGASKDIRDYVTFTTKKDVVEANDFIAKQKEQKKPEAAQEKIEDFGEKLEGAKKDLWKDFKHSFRDPLPQDASKITLAKYFPEPDYEKMIADGAYTRDLATIKAMRDSIPAKPRKGYKLKDWVQKISTLREFTDDILTGKLNNDEVIKQMRDGRLSEMADRIDLYDDLGYPAFTKAGDWRVRQAQYSMYGGEKFSPAKTMWSVAKGNSFGTAHPTQADAINALRDHLLKEIEAGPQPKNVSLSLFRDRDGGVFIGKKVGPGKIIRLKDGFADVKGAREYLKANQADLAAELERRKNVPSERRETNNARVGQDYRGNADATPEKFAGEFGFRGVQFGNYVEQGKRALDLNDAYDALKDMAAIVHVPSRAISLNGTLGLAFGARGSGGKRAAAAHYEPDNIVINMTKNSGAGSLGHEWFHSLDHYFGSKKGGLYLTENHKYSPEVRDEVSDAFKGVVDAISKTGMRQRSVELDKTRTKDYWSTVRELGARAFEAYLIHKSAGNKESNDYLANIVGEQSWKILNGEDTEKNSSTYPYPTDSEMEKIAPAFDKLFDTLKTKETDGGVALYSLGNKAADRLQSTLLKTADAMRQGKGTGDQILGYLRKQAGVKEEEIAWTGLDDFLKGKTGVTREDVVNYLKENQVRVEEHTLGDEPDEQAGWMEEEDGKYVVYGPHGHEIGRWADHEEAGRELSRVEDDYSGPTETKFSQYALPGGENYREVLMTLPEKPLDVPPLGRIEHLPNGKYRVDAPGLQAELFNTREDAEAETRRLGEIFNKDRAKKDDKNNFRSQHFDQTNIIAHVRLDDRTDVDGKKVLFVEEMQSDWHQKGRKHGYKTDSAKKEYKDAIDAYRETIDRISNLKHSLEGQNPDTPLHEKLRENLIQAIKDQETARDKLDSAEKNFKTVPDAPFKKSWHEMTFRRVAQMAAQGGYDRVAWTTGDQQNDRFDLSKSIERIEYNDKTHHLMAFEKGSDIKGRPDINETVTPENLPDHIGKEAAEKIMQQEPGSDKNGIASKGYRVLNNQDLKVGGEGMKGFYDKIIPQYAAKFGKKFGATVGKTNVSVGKGLYKNFEEFFYELELKDISEATPEEINEARAEWDDNRDDAVERRGGTIEAHSMDITPAMRESADAGFELFKQKDANLPATRETARAGDIQAAINEQMKKQGYTDANVKLFSSPEETGIAGMDAGAEGVYHNGIIHISMDAAEPLKVLDHETIHELKAAGAFTPAEWKTLETKAGEWRKNYKIDENYADHDLSDRQLNEEGIAHAFQDHKVQGPVRRIINRVLNFFKAIRDFLRGKGFNFKSAEDIFDSVAKGDVSKRESAQRGREEIKNREAVRAGEETEEDFPKYDLGKTKGPALDEAKDSLSKVKGIDRTLISDIKRVSAAILHPHQIATLYKEFTPVYRAVIQRYKDREVLTHQLSSLIDPYNRLNADGKKGVDAALEIGRLTGETFKAADDGTITVKNDGLEHTVHSKDGDTVTLTPTEAKAYKGVRDMLNTALDKYKETILEEAGLLDKGITSAQDVEKLRAKAVQDGDVDQVRNLKNVLQRLNDVDSAKKKGYVPFKRWGDIGISVKNEDGDTVHFEKVQTSRRDRKKGYIGESKAVQAAIERLTKQYPGDEHAIHAFEMSKFDDVKAHVDLRALDILAHSSDMPASEYERLREMLEKEMQKKGYRSHFFKAKDVPGYSDDFERAINDYVVTISSYISRRLNNRKIEDSVANVATTGKQKLHEYAKNYVDYVSSPEEELAQIRMLGFTWYLAGNLSSGLSYLTQPLMLTAPWFSAKFGHIEIGKAMTKGYADAIKMIDIPKMGANAFDFSKAPDDVRDGLIKAQNEGEFMSTGTNDAMAISSTSQSLRGLDKGRRTVSNALAAPFSIAERTNRVVTWMSAYRLAMKPGAQDKIRAFIKKDELGRAMLQGKNTPEAFAQAYADLAVVSTQFRHGKLNRPQMARGFGSLVFQFQSWTMQALELLYKLNKVNGGKNYKALAAIILSVTALAGVKGLPFEEDAKNLIEALFKFTTKKDLDIETDVRAAIIKYTHSAVVAEALIKGVPAALLNIDMSNRLGIGSSAGADLFHGGLGPWADILYKQPMQAAKDAADGQYLQALADVAPQFIHNPLEAYIWSHDGVRTQSGNKVIDASKVSDADAGLKAIGFTPSSVSDKRDASYAESRANTAVNDLRSSYTSQIARLIVANAKLYDDKGQLLPGATQKQSDQISSEINSKFDEMNRNNQDEPLYKQVYLTRAAIKQQVLKEMEGSDAMKPRKQAREEVQNIKNTYNAQ